MIESLKLQVPAQSGIAATRDDQLPLKVVDGLAQVYKTPLTVILGASAGLSENACKYSAIGSTIKIVADGGRAWVTSSEPEGTAFCVSIPSLVQESCSP